MSIEIVTNCHKQLMSVQLLWTAFWHIDVTTCSVNQIKLQLQCLSVCSCVHYAIQQWQMPRWVFESTDINPLTHVLHIKQLFCTCTFFWTSSSSRLEQTVDIPSLFIVANKREGSSSRSMTCQTAPTRTSHVCNI